MSTPIKLLVLIALLLGACGTPATTTPSATEAGPSATPTAPSPQNTPLPPPNPQNREISVTKVETTYPTARGGLSGWFSTGQAADMMLSGEGFNETGGGLLFNHPGAIASDGAHVALADRNNNRVLIWNTPPTGNTPPDVVLGQPDFDSNTPGTGANGMNWPVALSMGGGKLVVADTYNERLLIWNTFPTQNATPADLILKTGPTSKWRLIWPWGVWTDGTKLAATSTQGDVGVWLWNTFPTSADDAPDVKLTAAGQFGTPRGITSNGEYLLVGDHNAQSGGGAGANGGQVNRATFVWTQWPTNDTPPEFALPGWLQGEITDEGQLLMVSSTDRELLVWNALPTPGLDPVPDLRVGGADFNFMAGDGADIAIAEGRVYIALSNGNRVVVYNNGAPAAAQQLPDFAIGAPDVRANTLETEFIISNPIPATDGKSLFVVSDFDRKLYVWKTIPDQSGAHPDWVYTLPHQMHAAIARESKLVLAGQEQVLIWNTLPLNGELPDVQINGALGGVSLRNISGMAWDAQYFYLSDMGADKVYVWAGLPQADTPPAMTLTWTGPGALSSDGTTLALTLNYGRDVALIPVTDLATAQPTIIPINSDLQNPGADGRFNMPGGLLLTDGRLLVADTGFGRVHIWNTVAAALAGQPADILLGATDPHDGLQEIGVDKLFWPRALAFDGSYLWVGEFKFSERLVRFSVR